MIKKSVHEIEQYLEKYKNISELENFFKKELIFPPCITMKKHNVSEVFGDFHHHDLYEILYIVSGEVLYSIDDKKYSLTAGDMVLISPSILHKLIKINKQPCQRIVLTFTENYAKSLSTQNTNILLPFILADKKGIHKITLETHMKKRIEHNFDLMSELLFDQNYGSDLSYNYRFIQTMLLIHSAFINAKENELTSSNENIVVNKIIEFINKNLHKKILIKNIADSLALSISRISHIFKEQTGISIIKYINKKRLILSKELLRNGEPLTDIFIKCGFQDYTNFFRCFKKEYGITPKTYLTSYSKHTHI